MVNQQRVVNVAHRHAVMVNDHHALTLLVDLLAFQQALLVGIHHNEQRLGRDHIQSILRRNEVMALPRFVEGLDQLGCQRGVPVDGNDRRNITQFAHAQRTDGSAHRVQIGHTVAHDDDAVALADQVTQRIGNDAAAHMAALLHTVGYAAVKLETVHRLDGALVAAPAKGDVDAFTGHFLALFQRPAVAHANGQGGQPTRMQRTDPVKNIKTLLQHHPQVAFLHHRNVAAVGNAAQETVGASDILLQQFVDGLQFPRLFAVLHVIEQFIVAVNHDDQIRRAAGRVFVQCVLIKRIIHQIDHCGTFGAGAGAGVGSKPVIAHRQILPMRAGTHREIQLRQHFLNGIGQPVPLVKNLFPESFIIP